MLILTAESGTRLGDDVLDVYVVTDGLWVCRALHVAPGQELTTHCGDRETPGSPPQAFVHALLSESAARLTRAWEQP